MKSAWIIPLVLYLGASSAHAQSGLLFGIRYRTATGTVYRTYWVKSGTAGPRISREFPDLVVARATKLWRAGVYEHSYLTCPSHDEAAEHDDWHCFRNIESKLYVVPIEQPPRIDVMGDDPRPIPSGADEEEQLTTQAEGGDDLCRTENTVLTYLDPALIGYFRQSSTTEFCDPARYSTRRFNELVRIDEFQQPLSAGQPKGIDVLKGLTTAQKRAIGREFNDQADEIQNWEDPVEAASFTITRGIGRWVILGWLAGPTSKSEGIGIQFDTPAPSILISEADNSGVPERVLRKIHADDYFVSHDGRLIVVVAGRRILGGTVQGGKISRLRELVSLPADENGRVQPVMAQWITGKRMVAVDRELQRAKLPDLQVVESRSVQ